MHAIYGIISMIAADERMIENPNRIDRNYRSKARPQAAMRCDAMRCDAMRCDAMHRLHIYMIYHICTTTHSTTFLHQRSVSGVTSGSIVCLFLVKSPPLLLLATSSLFSL